MALENLSSSELEVSYYISTGELSFQGSSSRFVEEQQSEFFLKQLRYEEYMKDGLTKKRRYMEGTQNKMTFKVMSYNVLSQQLLDQHRYLYRIQPSNVLRWEYRFPRLLAQIAEEDPDILCLQEVQESHIESFYNRLEEIGYKGIFKKRTGGKVDGCAIYFRSCLFHLVDWTSVEYFQPKVSLLNRDNVGIISKLKLNETEIIIATTHLLYNPRRSDIRLAQLQLFFAEVHRFANSGDHELPVIVTGDFNSKPNSQVLKFVLDGSIQHRYPPLPGHLGILPTCTHASEPRLYSSEKGDEGTMLVDHSLSSHSTPPNIGNEKSQNMYQPTSPKQEHIKTTVSHQLNLYSVYSFGDEENVVATTYQDEWVTVDYILYSFNEKLELLSRLRLPNKDECINFIQDLPNSASPSDHLPLAATFALKLL